MKNLFVLFSLLWLFAACEKNPESYVIRGTVDTDSLSGKTVYLSQIRNKQLFDIDSSRVEEKMFLFQGQTDTVSICFLRFGRQVKNFTPLAFVLQNGNILIDIDSNSKVSGSDLNNALSKYNELRVQFNKELDVLHKEYRLAVDEKRMTVMEEQVYKEKYNAIRSDMKSRTHSFVHRNINNLIGGYVFGCYPNDFSDAEKSDILQKALPEFYSNPEIETIAERLQSRLNMAVGKKMSDVELKSLTGDRVKLSQFLGKGNYTVVNFWASWSEPSRRYVEELKPVYYRFRRQGFDVVSISLDKDSAIWAWSARNLWLPWNHLSDLKGWKSDVVRVYGLDAVPMSVLIAPDGTIESKNIPLTDLNERLFEIYFPTVKIDSTKQRTGASRTL